MREQTGEGSSTPYSNNWTHALHTKTERQLHVIYLVVRFFFGLYLFLCHSPSAETDYPFLKRCFWNRMHFYDWIVKWNGFVRLFHSIVVLIDKWIFFVNGIRPNMLLQAIRKDGIKKNSLVPGMLRIGVNIWHLAQNSVEKRSQVKKKEYIREHIQC